MATEWARIFATKKETIVEALGATKTYRYHGSDLPAVRNATLRIRPGTLTVLIGPSGAGKTTLLHMFAGFVKPTEGKILFRGLDLSKAEEIVLKLLREEYISLVFQEESLIGYLTAEENVLLPLELMGVRKDDRTDAAREALRILGLNGRRHHLVGEMSGGERQGVNLARAFAKRPLLILADEPTANLDTESSKRIMDTIKRHIEALGTTFIVATHDPVIAEQADLLLSIRDGQITVPAQHSLRQIEFLPLRYLNPAILKILEEEIRDDLLMRTAKEGDTIVVLDTPLRVLGTPRPKGEKGLGLITPETELLLHPEGIGGIHAINGETGAARKPTERESGIGRKKDDRDSALIAISPEKKPMVRTGHLAPLYLVLASITLLPSTLLGFLSIAVWLRLGVWTSVSTAGIFVALFLSLQALLLRPARLTKLRIPFGKLCRICGLRQSTQACHQCGRPICPECIANISEPPFCSECITCPICGRAQISSSCLICGDYVCASCIRNGVCIECSQTLATRSLSDAPVPGRSRPPKALEKLSTMILEPEEDIANEICRKLGRHIRQDIAGMTATAGDRVPSLGTFFHVAASLPIEGGLVSGSTHVNVVNRQERDAKLRKLREISGFPTCYEGTCDYMINRRCWTCGRVACPNHSIICRECGNIACLDHHKEGVCDRCSRKHQRPKAKEILSPLAPHFVVVAFLLILLGGKQLATVHPLLQTALLLGLFSLPVSYYAYSFYRRRANRQ